MDYRSRQRVPSEQISNKVASSTQSTESTSTNKLASATANVNGQQASISSTKTLSSSLGVGATDQQLESLQSSSMMSNYSQSNQQQLQQQRLLSGANKMNQQQQQQFQQRANVMQAQNANKQRLIANQQQQLAQQQQQQNNRLLAARSASSNAPLINTNYGVANSNKNILNISNKQHLHHQQQPTANSLLLHNHNSSGDNLTTSSGEQTMDDLQQLAHGYRNPNNPSHDDQERSKVQSNKMSPMYTFGVNDRQQDSLNALSPRLTAGPSSSSTTTTASSLAATSSAIITRRNPDYMRSHSGGSRFLLGVLFTLAEILLFSVLLLWLYWAFQHDDGLSWQADRKQQFNSHAALMILGFIFLNGQAMLIYRSFQCCTKIYTKILHALLFVLATSAIGFGLCLAYTAQENVGANNKPIMHFYSLHAWIGLSSVGLFALQFAFGFITFLVMLCCEQATSKFRAALLPIHKTFGLIIFSLAISTCLTGLLQTARSRLSSKLAKVDYHELGEAGIVINVIGACLICLAILMPYIIRNLDMKRATHELTSAPCRSRKRTSSQDPRLRLSEMDMPI